MKFFLIITFSLFPILVKADQPRYRNLFTSQNEKYELKNENSYSNEWHLVEKESKKILYKLRGSLFSMTVVVSDDGKSVVAIDDYSEQEEKKNPEVLLFFSNGKKIKSYKLYDLMESRKVVSFSASHFSWLYAFQPSYKPFLIENSNINLQTFELNNYSFDIETGETLKKEKDEILSGNTVYVSGYLDYLGNDKYRMGVQCVIYGKVPRNKKIVFESVKHKWTSGSGNETLIIKDGKMVARKGVIFNNCK